MKRWKAQVVFYFKAVFQYLLGGTEEYYTKKKLSGPLASRSKFELVSTKHEALTLITRAHSSIVVEDFTG
jgi:hypothetical protein